MEKKDNNLEIITLLRLPLAIGVLFIHSITFTKGLYPIYDVFYKLLTVDYAGLCVPLFFFFSGYLFFRTVDQFSMKNYSAKLRRRVDSLLFPYLFWNLFFIGIIWAGQVFLPTFFTGQFKQVAEFSPLDWLSLFYGALGTNQPIAYQLWFIRDLICLTVATPLIYFLCKKLDIWWILVFCIAFVFNLSFFDAVRPFSTTFYSLGCYFGIKKISFTFNSDTIKWCSIILYLILILIEFFISDNVYYKEYLMNVNLLIGCVALLQFSSILLDKKRAHLSCLFHSNLSGFSFFLYCYHGIFASFLSSRLLAYVNNDLSAILSYLLIVAFLLGFGYLAFIAMQKLLPRFTLFITGGRNGVPKPMVQQSLVESN